MRIIVPSFPVASPEAASTPEAPTTKRKISAAAHRRMAIAQKKRWAATKGEYEPPAPLEAPKAKRKISKEGLARIVAATKKRWAAVRAAIGTALVSNHSNQP